MSTVFFDDDGNVLFNEDGTVQMGDNCCCAGVVDCDLIPAACDSSGNRNMVGGELILSDPVSLNSTHLKLDYTYTVIVPVGYSLIGIWLSTKGDISVDWANVDQCWPWQAAVVSNASSGFTFVGDSGNGTGASGTYTLTGYLTISKTQEACHALALTAKASIKPVGGYAWDNCDFYETKLFALICGDKIDLTDPSASHYTEAHYQAEVDSAAAGFFPSSVMIRAQSDGCYACTPNDEVEEQGLLLIDWLANGQDTDFALALDAGSISGCSADYSGGDGPNVVDGTVNTSSCATIASSVNDVLTWEVEATATLRLLTGGINVAEVEYWLKGYSGYPGDSFFYDTTYGWLYFSGVYTYSDNALFPTNVSPCDAISHTDGATSSTTNSGCSSTNWGDNRMIHSLTGIEVST